MAHMTDGKGPYPDKAGEHCGNHLPGSSPLRLIGQTQAEADSHQEDWLAKMRSGKPSNCEVGTSEEMAAKGFVGLYLTDDRDLFDWETPVDTDELTEAVVSKETSTMRNPRTNMISGA